MVFTRKMIDVEPYLQPAAAALVPWSIREPCAMQRCCMWLVAAGLLNQHVGRISLQPAQRAQWT
jgi:hypothetical protein